MKTRYRNRFEKIQFSNRWKQKYPPDDWCVIGIQIWWFNPVKFEYRICLFGLMLRIYIKRQFK